MSKLWIYGDSYGYDWGVDWGWQRLLADGIGVEKGINVCAAGTSNDWIAHKFASDAQSHSRGDFVVVILTEPKRQWFYENKPWLSNLASISQTDMAQDARDEDPNKARAVMDYFAYIQRDQLDDIRTLTLFSYLMRESIEREINLQIIPGFEMATDWRDLWECTGTLTSNVCDREFKSRDDLLQWYNTSIDTRANHLTRNNHEILAAKLIARFVEGVALDLTEGFETDVIGIQDKTTHPGLLDELVDKAKTVNTDSTLRKWLLK